MEALIPSDDRKPFWFTLGAVILLSVVPVLWSYAHAGQRSQGMVYLPHPAGCPRVAFCGCGAAWDIFGQPRRDLWPSTAWFKFQRTTPKPNAVAVRRGHVFVLKQHVRADVWKVADYNSGGHRSRLHNRSIAGYVIVDPRSRVASL